MKPRAEESLLSVAPKPDLTSIIESLHDCLNSYERLVLETRRGLQLIKPREGLNETEAKETSSNSVVEELYKIIHKFNKLNNMAEVNVIHLRELVD